MKKRNIAVIGAGAAGMMAAVTAARGGAAVTIYEHRGEAGRKLLMTGNGKCNLTNKRMGASYYYCDSECGQRIVSLVLADFDEKRTLAFFHEIGLLTYDRDGYVYPQSEQAVTVRDVLVRECLHYGVRFRYDTDVYRLLGREEATDPSADRSTGSSTDRVSYQFVIGKERFDRLILACGGKSERQTGSDGSGYELAKRFGHSIRTPLPALVPLFTNEEDWQSMAGVRLKARLCLYVEGQAAGEARGELQMTAQGISGIPVFELSRVAVHAIHEGKRVEAEICFLDGRERTQIEALLRRMLGRKSRASLEETVLKKMTGIVNEKALSFLLRKIERGTNRSQSGLPEGEHLAAAMTEQLFSCRIAVNGHGKLEHAQVTSGGVRFDEVTEHLESRLCKGLFFAGEMLDVDGICGGYNLQWAWSSGAAAAAKAVR